MTNRLFVALEIPSTVLDELIEIRNKIYPDSGVRWEAKEKLHITLKFLGDVEDSLNDSIIKMIEERISGKKRFNLFFEKFGLFKKDGKPRILWVKTNDSNVLEEVQKEIEEGCSELGFKKEERKFKPHLTLLRVRGSEDFRKIYSFTNEEIPEINFAVSEIALIKSELKQSGSVYHTIKSFYLN